MTVYDTLLTLIFIQLRIPGPPKVLARNFSTSVETNSNKSDGLAGGRDIVAAKNAQNMTQMGKIALALESVDLISKRHRRA